MHVCTHAWGNVASIASGNPFSRRRCARPAPGAGSRLLPPDRGTARRHRRRVAVARKLLKRSYHTLRELGEEALAPA